MLYDTPLECPHVDGSWCDRFVVRPAPVGSLLVSACWIWLGWNNAKPGGAYGKVKIRGRCEYLHRVMWERHNGLLLRGGETIDHLCRVRLCFNPAHLENVSYEENNERARDYAAKFTEVEYEDDIHNPAHWR